MNDVPYQRRYRLNSVGRDRLSTSVTIPPEVIDKKAREAGLSITEFIKKYIAIAEYDGFDGVRYRFEPAKTEANGDDPI